MTDLEQLAESIEELCRENLALKNLLQSAMPRWKDRLQQNLDYLRENSRYCGKILSGASPTTADFPSIIRAMNESLQQIRQLNDIP